MRIAGIIPARFKSTRFPGKPLADINGKPMIQHVVEKAQQARQLDAVLVATDDARIAQVVEAMGVQVVMTAEDIASGTDRCWAAVQAAGQQFDYVINIQGDEPFIDPREIDRLALLCREHSPQLGTLVMEGMTAEDLLSPNKVKVVLNDMQEALYFSRSPIPFIREVKEAQQWVQHHSFYQHVGMYAYQTQVLEQVAALPQSSLELAESLEQLRWLQAGFRIKVAFAEHASIGVDTPEDLARAAKLMEALPPSL